MSTDDPSAFLEAARQLNRVTEHFSNEELAEPVDREALLISFGSIT